MRSEDRIEPFLKRFAEDWKKNPDYRFTQLIVNLMQAAGNDFYYTEDEKFIKLLEKYYENA